jgi:hypothetical protein
MCGDDRRSALQSFSRNFRNGDIRFEDLFPFEMEFMSKSGPGSELDRMDKDEEPDTANMLIKSIKHKFFDIEVSCSCIQGARFAVASMLGCDIRCWFLGGGGGDGVMSPGRPLSSVPVAEQLRHQLALA